MFKFISGLRSGDRPRFPKTSDRAANRDKRSKWPWIVSIVILLVIAGVVWEKMQERSYRIDRTEVSAFVGTDGSLTVYEIYDYRFKGHYDGVTRALPSRGYEQIKSFDAYLVKPGFSFRDHSPESGIRATEKLKTTNRYENGLPVYRAYREAENETVTVLYRYELSGAVVAEQGTALLNWSFFDADNQSEIRNLDISVTLPDSFAASRISVFLEDRYGGRIVGNDGRTLHYVNERLPKYSESRLHIRFPAESVPNARIGQALPESGELALQRRYELREQLPAIPRTLLIFAAASAALFLFTALFRLARERSASAAASGQGELLKLDPLRLAYIRRQGWLEPEDLAAALLSLKHKGALRIEKEPKHRKSSDLRHYRLTPLRSVSLRPSEHFLLDWLLPDGKSEPFTLKSVAGPGLKERRDPSKLRQAQEDYRKQFEPNFREWAKLAGEEEPLSSDVRRNPLFVPLSLGIAWSFAALIAYLLAAGIASRPVMIWSGILFVFSGAIGTWFNLFLFRSSTLMYRVSIVGSGLFAAVVLLNLNVSYEFGLAALVLGSSMLIAAALPQSFLSRDAVRIRSSSERFARILTAQPGQARPTSASLPGSGEAEQAERLASWLIAAGIHRNPQRPTFNIEHTDERYPLSANLDASLKAFDGFAASLGYPMPPGGSSGSSSNDSGSSYTGTGSSDSGSGGHGGAGAF